MWDKAVLHRPKESLFESEGKGEGKRENRRKIGGKFCLVKENIYN